MGVNKKWADAISFCPLSVPEFVFYATLTPQSYCLLRFGKFVSHAAKSLLCVDQRFLTKASDRQDGFFAFFVFLHEFTNIGNASLQKSVCGAFTKFKFFNITSWGNTSLFFGFLFFL